MGSAQVLIDDHEDSVSHLLLVDLSPVFSGATTVVNPVMTADGTRQFKGQSLLDPNDPTMTTLLPVRLTKVSAVVPTAVRSATAKLSVTVTNDGGQTQTSYTLGVTFVDDPFDPFEAAPATKA